MPYKDPKRQAEYHKRYMRERYLADPEHRRAHLVRVRKNDKLRTEKLKAIVEVFRSAGCLVCSEKEPCTLTAHHLDPAEKDFNISEAVTRKMGVSKLEQELLKCVCLCRNCHAKVHAGVIRLPN